MAARNNEKSRVATTEAHIQNNPFHILWLNFLWERQNKENREDSWAFFALTNLQVKSLIIFLRKTS